MALGDKVSIHADAIKAHGEYLGHLKGDYLDYSKDTELVKVDVKPGDFEDANDLKAKVTEIINAAKTFLTNSGKAAEDISKSLIDNANYYKNTDTETVGTANDFNKIGRDLENDLPGYNNGNK
jgi:hypothetical protein